MISSFPSARGWESRDADRLAFGFTEIAGLVRIHFRVEVRDAYGGRHMPYLKRGTQYDIRATQDEENGR
jgi:hypothetical protein